MMSVVATAALINDVETIDPNLTVNEGELKLVSHLARERNRVIIANKKRQALDNGTLFCEVCDFSFIQRFQQEFIECHHIVPIAQTGARATTMGDLALVCSNCHRMLHAKFDGRYLSITELRAKINQ
ncbi:MAG: HNH endonuclease [Bacteroidetes bacterium]|nr:HNH endonuclease [Bacteroidota bacterium]